VSARERILERVRAALADREATDYPGPFESWRPTQPPPPVEWLTAMLRAAGAEVVAQPDEAAAASWLRTFSADVDGVTIGETVPQALRPQLPVVAPDAAPLGVSVARGAIAETGSLLMDARDGRRSQLLAPTHVVFVRASDVHTTFRDAVLAMQDDLPSAIGLHSGPSKSADIGHVMVKGVHGPGRLIAVVIGAWLSGPSAPEGAPGAVAQT
jgi:L-lactate dehydrogenase complex protein LldG